MEIGEGEVHVWLISASEEATRLSRLATPLSAGEQKRVAAFKREEARRSFIVGHGALRLLVGAYLGREPSAVEFTTGVRGKPALARRSYPRSSAGAPGSTVHPPESLTGGGSRASGPAATLQFSLSHSGDLVLIAFSATWEIGVDIERLRSPELSPLLPLALAPAESAELSRLPRSERHRRFFELWTRKEALAKAIGLGIALPLREILFREKRETEEGRASLVLEAAPAAVGDPSRWRVAPVNAPPGYVAAIAVPDPDPRIELRRFEDEVR